MSFFNFPNNLKRPLIVVLAVSVIISGLAGGVSGLLVSAYSDGVLRAWVRASLGLPSEVANGNFGGPLERTVVESSQTVDVVARAIPSVVSIVATQDLSDIYNRTGPRAPFDFFFREPYLYNPPSGRTQVSSGTGFIITTDGMIVTNRHVVQNESADYSVILNDGTQHGARVLARDTVNDIAVLSIAADNLPVLDLGDSDFLKIGQTVIAIGNSLGEYSNTVTRGVVSGINRRVIAGDSSGLSEVLEEAIQTDAAINPGNSGGPLLDLFGKVIGVNTAVSLEGQLIGFAIPINSVKKAIESVKQHGRIVRPFLGVRYILLSPEIARANDIQAINHGALVARGSNRTDLAVVPGSPADKAGVRENDIILSINGKPITQENSLSAILTEYGPGDKVKLKIYRQGKEEELEAELTERE